VNVIDENNNAPKFIRTVYSQSIPESASIGSLVVQVQATDVVSTYLCSFVICHYVMLQSVVQAIEAISPFFLPSFS
jgi:hypothetical protein